MLAIQWFLAICTFALLIGCSVMIILCLSQIASEMLIEPFKAFRQRLTGHRDELAATK